MKLIPTALILLSVSTPALAVELSKLERRGLIYHCNAEARRITTIEFATIYCNKVVELIEASPTVTSKTNFLTDPDGIALTAEANEYTLTYLGY